MEASVRVDAVVGLAFSDDMRTVLLIRKRRPASQAGKLNGVGGKVEPGETFLDAMVREFREESGIDTSPESWTHFATLDAPRWQIAFFRTVLPLSVLDHAAQGPVLTHEQLELHSLVGLRDQVTMSNLRWMVPLCLDDSPYRLPILLQELPEERPGNFPVSSREIVETRA